MLIDVTERPEVKAFIIAATEFCGVIDLRDELTADELLQQLYPVLPLLAHRASQLPDVPPVGEAQPGPESVLTGPVYDTMLRKLGRLNFYWEVFNPYETGVVEAINGSPADDMEDIYQDVQPGVVAWPGEGPDGRRAILWHWRFSYYSHWGHHIIDALRAIHALVSQQRMW